MDNIELMVITKFMSGHSILDIKKIIPIEGSEIQRIIRDYIHMLLDDQRQVARKAEMAGKGEEIE